MPGEFDIISRYFHQPGNADDTSLPVGIGDDGAVLRPSEGHDSIVVTDTLVAGRHFPQDASPGDIGWRALAVNLSDCVAMAARPRFAFLNISLPDADESWLQEFAEGFFALAKREGVILAGGDTTRGPLTVTVTVMGEAPRDAAILRKGALEGDAIFVTGWPGRARAALEHWQRGEVVPAELQQPWQRPEPRMAMIEPLRRLATAAIDISDGLVADLGHILASSGKGAVLDAQALPVHHALEASVGEDAIDFVLHGGDDYEILFTAPAGAEKELQELLEPTGLALHRIGTIDDGETLRLATSDTEQWELPLSGFDHFAEGEGA
ncbi:MAG: thiamine-phosphate kinase [Gammaproteobacteria bacterium]|nr:thiamine-phosphate kinase [Gammaproteobacteria bacterium]